jgi:hypothetical protein
MKTMKVALLATAALAAVTVSARADDSAAIKAQLEALNARIAQLEAAPAVPTGYSLLTIGDGVSSATPGLEVLNKDAAAAGDKATVIGIMPTADMPASTTIEWSGYVRAAIVYDNFQGSNADDGVDVRARGQLKVKAKTDTAVGEVGVVVQLRAQDGFRGDGSIARGTASLDVNPGFVSNEYWGYWAMTPELTLGGGYTGSLGNIGYGYDGACNCYYTDNADVAFNPGDAKQMRLSYASGPLSMAVAIEDASNVAAKFGGTGDALGVAGEIKYAGDVVSGEISAVYHARGRDNVYNNDDSYQVGMGLGFALGDMASLSLAGALGQVNTGQDFWGASVLASANLSDAIHAEVGFGYKDYDNAALGFVDNYGVLAGIYYDPVSQLTIGLEAEYINPKGSSNNGTRVDLVTIFRF